MKINQAIAQKIVYRTMNIIPYSVNVMNEDGVIIASGNRSRLNQQHTGAVLAIRENRTVEISAELAEKWCFAAREGINLPIQYQGKILGVVGISGPPAEVKPFAELVKMSAELITEHAMLLEQERWRHRYKEEFFLTAIKQPQLNQTLLDNAHHFEIDFNTYFICIILQLSQANVDNLQRLFTFLEHRYPTKMMVMTAFDQITLLQTLDSATSFHLPERLFNHLPLKAKIATGGIFTGTQAIYFAYTTALSTLNYGTKHAPHKSKYRFQDYTLPTLLEHYLATWQSQELLKPLAILKTAKYATLRQTLEKYFSANCDPIHTSKALFIHPNSLRYRLQKIEEITGLSFNNIDEKFMFYLFSLQQKYLEKPTKKFR